MQESVSKSPSDIISSIALVVSKHWMSSKMLMPKEETATTFDVKFSLLKFLFSYLQTNIINFIS